MATEANVALRFRHDKNRYSFDLGMLKVILTILEPLSETKEVKFRWQWVKECMKTK